MRDYYYRVITERSGGFGTAVIRFFLLILSVLYRGIMAVRNVLYKKGFLRTVDLGKPVISVGNVTWGGVGKTPFVIFLAEHLQKQGFRPAILTRGYMNRSALSDEAEMFRQELPGIPIGVGSDRVKAAQKLLATQAVDVFILDDGFQHRKIKRDLDIVLVNSTNSFGNGEMIPRGILREPLEALKRADAIILTKTDVNPSAAKVLEERLKKICPSCPIAWAVHQPRSCVELFSGQKETLSSLNSKGIMSFCSIGDPVNFEETLIKIGVESKKNFIFPDHHVYSESDLRRIIAEASKAGVDALVTTAKDGVKLLQFKDSLSSLKCWILKIQFEIEVGKDGILGRVDHLLGR